MKICTLFMHVTIIICTLLIVLKWFTVVETRAHGLLPLKSLHWENIDWDRDGLSSLISSVTATQIKPSEIALKSAARY